MSGSDFTYRFVPGSESPAKRVLLLLHGTGGNENDLLSLGRDLDLDAALLSPRGKVLENGMPRFFRRLAEGVFDEEDVIRRAHELADFVAQSAAEYQFDQQTVIAVGYSNGANIASATLLLRPDTFSRAILLRAMVPLVPEPLPNLSRARILISSGAQDPIVPVENARRLAAMFQAAGADVTIRVEAGGHSLARGDLVAAKEWLTKIEDDAGDSNKASGAT